MVKTSVLALCGVVALGACKPEVATVEVTPDQTAMTGAGETAKLKATSRDKEGKEIAGRAYKWSSSADAIAAVDQNGQVTAKADGDAVITAVDMEKQATAKVSVSIPSRVEMSPPTLTLKTGEPAAALTAKVLDGRGRELAGKEITWASDKETVAKIDKGLVTGVGVGTANINATWGKLMGSATVIVTEGAAAAPEGEKPAEEHKGKK